MTKLWKKAVVCAVLLVTAVSFNACEKEKTVTAQNGDNVVINCVGTVDGVAFEGGTFNGVAIVLGSGQFIDGFEEQMVGMEVGETKDVVVTFPDPYQNDTSLSGKEAVFKTTLVEIIEE